jgi:uncharacterized iron-regulated membrane protein
MWIQIHRWAGLIVGLFFLLSCISGAVLVFEKELDPVLYPAHYYHQANSEGRVLPLDSLIHLARDFAKPLPLQELSIPADFPTTGNLIFRTDGGRLQRNYLALNPYTGMLTSTIPGGRHVFTFAEEFHRRLLLNDIGKKITGICCLIYLLILISGLILWWPKNKKVLKQRVKVTWDASRKRLNWDIHSVGGFYALALLFLMCFTGLTWSFKSFESCIFYIFDGKGKPKEEKISFPEQQIAGDRFIYQNTYRKAVQLFGKENTILLDLEQENTSVVKVQIDQDEYIFGGRNIRMLHKTLLEDQSTGTKVREFMKPLHTANRFGIIGKSVYLVVVLFGASMPVTGLYIWLGRKKKKKK